MAEQMNGQDLPLNWYGRQNYLGKPVNVAVQGETPTGSSKGAPAALAAGGGGPTGTSGRGAIPGSPSQGKTTAPINGGSSNTIQNIMNSLGYAGMGAQGISGMQGMSKILSPKNNAVPEEADAEESGVKTAENLGEKAAESVGEKAAAQGATGVGSDLTLDAAMGPVGLLTMLGQGLNTAGKFAGNALFKDNPHANEAVQTAVDLSNPASAVAEGLSGLSDLFMGNIKGFLNEAPVKFAEDALHNPVGMVTDMWNGLFGAPPAFAFPNESLNGIIGQINNSLPKELTAPQGATPEQHAAVQKANDIIKQIGKYRDSLPARFNSLGNQSAQSWQYELNNATNPYLQSQFNELRPAYEQAIASLNQAPKAQEAAKPMIAQKAIEPKERTDSKGDKVLGSSFYRGKQKDDVQS